MSYKFGYIAVVGKPNAGKSTLVNFLTQNKVAIVSPKAQTTRNNILGILTTEHFQLVFIDTPGLHKSKNALDKFMNKNIRSAEGGADIILYLIDSTKTIDEFEHDYITSLKQKSDGEIIIVLNKVDLVKKPKLLLTLQELSTLGFENIVPISAKTGENAVSLMDMILKYLPESQTKNFLYDEDYYTDKSIKFMVSEIVREKALYFLNDEIPHGISVNITKFEQKPTLLVVEADIICEKYSHKSIIIGKNGTMIKKIGQNAREDIEVLVGKKVLLKLFVKVKKDWRENINFLTEFGYKNEDQ